MKVLVLEDERADFDEIRTMLNKKRNLYQVLRARNPEEAYQIVRTESPGLGLFDINLGESFVDGIAVAEKILSEYKMPILFLTKHYDLAEYATRVDQLQKDSFLPKMICLNEFEFFNAINKALSRFQKDQQPFKEEDRKMGFKPKGAKTTYHNKTEIIFIQADQTYTHIYLTQERKITSSTHMKHVEEQIQKIFSNIIRIDRSYMINLDKILALEEGYLSLDGYSKKIRISDAGLKRLSQIFPTLSTKR